MYVWLGFFKTKFRSVYINNYIVFVIVIMSQRLRGFPAGFNLFLFFFLKRKKKDFIYACVGLLSEMFYFELFAIYTGI